MRYTLFHRLMIVAGFVVVATFSRAADPPTIINFPTKDLDYPGEVVTKFEIHCRVTGTPPFTWTWKKFKIDNWSSPDRDITQSDGIYAISTNGTLTGPQRLDARLDGFYQCFVTNSAGTTFSRKIRVKITTAKKFDDKNDVTVDVTLGRAKTIKCPSHGENFGGTYDWGRKDALQNNYRSLGDKKHRIITAEGDLIFSYIKQEDIDDVKDIGGLQCRIEAGGTVRYSHIVTLNKAGSAYDGTTPPTFVVSLLGPYKATKGEEFVFHCAAIGKPTPVISWLKDGKLIVDGTYSYKQGLRSLKIEKVDKTLHEGQYECRARSSALPSPITSSARLDVEVAPKVTSYPGTNIRVGYNETLALVCNASGTPPPQVSWWMNGNQLQGGGRITLSSGAASISEVNLADIGVFQCVAENKVSMEVSMTHVQVMGKSPKFQKSSAATKVLRGSDVTLYCNPQGGPSPNITWMKDDKPIDINLPNSRFSIDSSNSLLIIETQQSDEVPFTCKAVNGYGEALLTWNVDILNKTVITTKPLDVRVIQGETAELHCKAKADASFTLQYKWLKDGEEITYNQQITWDGQKRVLQVRNVQIKNTGSYTCVAHTPIPYYSQDRASAVLRIQGVPDPPQNLQIRNCNDSKATLTWVLGDAANLTITHFVVEQESSYDKGVFYPIRNVTDPKATSTELELTPYANFTFRMSAFSDGVASLPSEPTKTGTCETKPAKPMKYPDNLRGISGGAGNLTIHWDALSKLEQNGPGFLYKVQLRKKSESNWMNAVTHPPHNYYHVKNAGVLVEWEFQVWGENNMDTGPQSPIATAFSGQDFPPKIQGLELMDITNSSVNLTWSAAAMINGHIDGYWVHYRTVATRRSREVRTNPKGGGQKLKLKRDACTNTTCFARITGLAAGARYEVFVTAFNSRGEGPRNKARTFETKDVPITPDGLEGITDGAGKLTITWKVLKKHDVKAPWLYYVLRWKRVKDKTWNVVNITDQSNTSYRVEDAGCNIHWEFQIWAVNEIGSSSSSNKVTKFSGECPPKDKPESLRMIRVTTKSVDLEWGALTDGSVYGYKVRYSSITVKTMRRDDPKKAWQTQQHKASAVCDSKKCRVAVAGLEVKTSYRIYVTAYNIAGEGPPSEQIVIETAAPKEPRKVSPEPWWKKAWFIAIIVCVILLAILLLVCIVCCCKRRHEKERGKGSYDVVKTSEKEAKKDTAV